MGTRVPNEALFHISEQTMSLEEKAFQLYDLPSKATIEHFKWLNGYLEDEQVKTGQMVIITPEGPTACQAWESDLAEVAAGYNAMVAELNDAQRRFLARFYAIIGDAMDYTSAGYGWMDNHFAVRMNQVERLMKQLEDLHRSTYARYGALKGSSFYGQRAMIFSKLDHALGNSFRRQLFRDSANRAGIKRQLGLSTKSTTHQFKAQGVNAELPQFHAYNKNLVRTGEYFSRLGYASIALDVAVSGARIAEVCTLKPDSPDCEKTAYAQTGRAAGSILGGAAGGYVGGTGVCLLLGLSTGVGGLACGVVLGGVGGYAGGSFVGSRGKMIGETIYETRVKVNN